MATNLYFSQKVKSEQNLYEDIVIESLKMYGQDVYYLPRDLVNEDRILGDDPESSFNSSHVIEMYIENTEGFEGEGDLFTRFGVEIRDEATFVVARKRWEQTVQRYDNEITSVRPSEGDLIYLPLSKSLFQISHVEHEMPFYQLSNLPVYKLRCTRFEYSSERLDTNVSDINKLEDDKSLDQLQYQFSLETATDGGTGSILLEGDTTNYLINEDYAIQTQQPYADNSTFESDAGFGTTSTSDDILDFTERNPFGEVDEGF